MPSWLFTFVAISMGVLGLPLLVWSLHDRPRGRLRCPKCWYDLSGSARRSDGGAKGQRAEISLPLVCPECGRRVTELRQLSRARRRYRWASLALLLLAGAYVIQAVPGIRQRGGWALMPTLLLIAIDDPHMGTDSFQYYPHTLSVELQNRWESGELNGLEAWLLARKTRSRLIVGRRIWPVGVDPRFEFNPIRLCKPGHAHRITVEPIGEYEVEHWASTGNAFSMVDGLPFKRGNQEFVLRGVQPSVRFVKFHVVVREVKSESDPGTVVRDFVLRRSLRFRGTIEDCIRPLEDEGARRAIAECMEPVMQWKPQENQVSGLIRFDIPELHDVGVALRVTYLRDGAEVGGVGPRCLSVSRFRLCVGETLILGAGSLPISDDFDPAMWIVRISGDAESALADFRARWYWDGVLEIPLQEVLHTNAYVYSSTDPSKMPDILKAHPEYLGTLEHPPGAPASASP